MMVNIFQLRITTLLVMAVCALGGAACQKFDAPPHASLPEAVGGILADENAPIIVAFTEPAKADSLSLKVIA